MNETGNHMIDGVNGAVEEDYTVTCTDGHPFPGTGKMRCTVCMDGTDGDGGPCPECGGSREMDCRTCGGDGVVDSRELDEEPETNVDERT